MFAWLPHPQNAGYSPPRRELALFDDLQRCNCAFFRPLPVYEPCQTVSVFAKNLRRGKVGSSLKHPISPISASLIPCNG
jgi:hypothetical protein